MKNEIKIQVMENLMGHYFDNYSLPSFFLYLKKITTLIFTVKWKTLRKNFTGPT